MGVFFFVQHNIGRLQLGVGFLETSPAKSARPHIFNTADFLSQFENCMKVSRNLNVSNTIQIQLIPQNCTRS